MHILHVLVIIALYLLPSRGDWVDPHSMDSNAKQKIRDLSPNAPDLSTKHCTHVVTCDSDLYLRRMVRLILKNAYFEEDMGYFIGHVNLQLSARDFKFLEHFSQKGEFKDGIFSEVNSIFETALQKTSFDKYKEMVLTFQEEVYFLIFNPTTGALVSAFLVLYLTYKLLKAKFTWRSILKYLFFITYIVDFAITYLHILQEEEIKSMVTIKKFGNVPPECDPQKLSWWDYTKTQFESVLFENPCKEFYVATHQNYKYLVAPSKVFTLQFRTIIVDTMEDLGEAFGKLGRRMFTNLPWGLNIALFPIMLAATCAIIFIVFLFITKPHFKLSLFHFFTIEVGQSVTHERARPALAIPPRNRRQREVGYNEQHRALVEEASNDNYSSYDDNQSLQEHEQEQIGANDNESPNHSKALNCKPDVKTCTFVQNLGPEECTT